MTTLFHLNLRDLAKSIVVAVLSGAALPILAIIQTPGFNFQNANWHAVFILAVNGGLAGFAGYIAKNFFSDENGKFLGRVG